MLEIKSQHLTCGGPSWFLKLISKWQKWILQNSTMKRNIFWKKINEHHIFGLSSFLQPEISTYLRLEDSDLNIFSIVNKEKINNVTMHMIMA